MLAHAHRPCSSLRCLRPATVPYGNRLTYNLGTLRVHRLPRLASTSESTVGSTNNVSESNEGPLASTPAPEAPAPSAPEASTSVTPESHPVAVDEDDVDMFATKELVQELTDTAQIGKRGEVWFIAQLLVMIMVVFPPLALHGLVDLLSILSISAGLVFCGYGVFSIGRSLSPLPYPRKSSKLATTGMYAYVRHPMYGGVLLICLGLTFLTGSETRFALSGVLWWLLEQKANLEEKLLAQLHPEYEEYKGRVKKFIPYIY